MSPRGIPTAGKTAEIHTLWETHFEQRLQVNEGLQLRSSVDTLETPSLPGKEPFPERFPTDTHRDTLSTELLKAHG